MAALLTAVGFAAIKLSAVAAGLAAPLLGGVTRQDPTDLVALVALLPAWRLLRRHYGRDDGSFGRTVPPQGRRPPPARPGPD